MRGGTMTRGSALVLAVAVVLAVPALAGAQTADVVQYYHTDAIGSVRRVTDATGQVVGQYDYRPFGEPWNTPVTPDRRQFAEKERDRETGFDYFGARYYTNATGRFTTVDPVMNIEAALTNPQRWNRYAYSLNNPWRFIDPDGAEITTPAVFFTKAFQQQNADNLRALGKVAVNIGRSINSPGHMTPEAEARHFEQPDSAAEASRMQFFDLVLTAAPALFGLRGQAGALRSVGSIDEVFSGPAALRGGVTPEQLMQRIGTLPETWRVEALGKGSKEGAGWMLREYTPQGNPTGRQIRWHPGGGHHGPEPYWRVINYNDKSDIIR